MTITTTTTTRANPSRTPEIVLTGGEKALISYDTVSFFSAARLANDTQHDNDPDDNNKSNSYK